jgi:HPt (histidine-containing phosphotransfer) domain-containing protein
MTALFVDAPVVFDASAVASLTGHCDDVEFAQVFVACYRRMLPERVRRIAAALGEQDLDRALDAVRSLTASSGIVGAGELVEIGNRLEHQLRRLELARAAALAGELPAAAVRAEQALTGYLGA